MRFVIIGGVAAGMSAASKLKRLRSDVQIDVYEQGEDVSYGACGMPYYLSDVIKDADSLIARSAQAFQKRGVNVHTNHKVLRVHPDKKEVLVRTPKQVEIRVPYDSLLVASGASAIRLDVPGRANENIHKLNSLQDARMLKEALHRKNVRKVAVVGGGYIGIEVAEALVELNKDVRLVEREDRILPGFDEDIAEVVKDALQEAGVKLYLGETLNAYEERENSVSLRTDASSIDADLVVEAVGVRPNTDFLAHTDIKRLANGAIEVNDKMETSVDSIYAAGDCASVPHRITKRSAYIPLGTHANKCGRVVAHQIAGEDKRFEGVVGSTVLKALSLEAAKTGIGKREAEEAGLSIDSVTIDAPSHAGYYPGMKKMKVKVFYNPDNCRLLGAQMVGEKGVAHRINVMAAALHANMAADEFAGLDLAYAPPFSPVWDPLQIACNQIKCEKTN